MNDNQIEISILAKNLASGVLDQVNKQVGALTQTTQGASKGTGMMSSALGTFAGVAGALVAQKLLETISSSVAQIGQFMQNASKDAMDFDKSMTTLSIISERFGVNGDKARETAQRLGKELRIGVGASAEALQNLLKGGLNLDQASDLLKRFTNEAITGKSSSITLAQAVENLSFAFTTENSAIGNLSGISENYIDIVERGAKAMGKKTSELTEAERIQAKYNGIIALTNLTLGSAEKFTGTLIDTQAQLDQQWKDMSITVGKALNPILSELYKNILIPFASFVNKTVIPIVEFGLNRVFIMFQNVLEGIRQPLNDLWIALEELFASVFTPENVGQIEEFGKRIETIVTVGTIEAIKFLIQKVTELVNWLKSSEGRAAIKEWATNLENVGKIMLFVASSYNDFVKPVLNSLWWFMTNFGIPAAQFIGSIMSIISPINIIKAVITSTIAVFERLIDIMSRTVDKVNSTTKTIKDKLGSLGNIGGSIGGAIGGALGSIGIPKLANGGSFVTDGPQMFVAGDNKGGKERVTVTPLSGPDARPESGGMNIVFNISGGDPMAIAKEVQRLLARANQSQRLGLNVGY